jgi:uncharacterized protein (TIGR02453 family)
MKAAPVSPGRFAGFPRHAFELLRQLGAQNDRRWFAANRRELEAALVAPALALVVDLGSVLRQVVSSDMRSEPRVGGSLLRMQHDARHVRAAPFRTHLELWFWEGDGPSRDHPGCFVQLAPDRMVVGAGMTLFPPHRVVPYREAVDRPRSGRELLSILRRLTGDGWSVRAGRRRSVPDPYPADHERGDLLRLTGLRVERREPLPDAVFEPTLPRALGPDYARLRPLHRWLVDVS